MLASNGLATPPCGVPLVLLLPPTMRRVPSPSFSSIGAFSHSLMSRSTCRSTILRATDLMRSQCGIESKEAATHYPSPRSSGLCDDHPRAPCVRGADAGYDQQH